MIDILGKIRHLRLVPAAVFIFDCSRFLFLLVILAVFLNTALDFKIVRLPLIMYASPNALFPLMSFFLLIRFNASRAFIPLYIVGKALCLLCVIIWILFSLKQKQGLFAPEVMWLMFLSAADLGTIMGMSTITVTAGETAEGGE